MEKNFNDIDHLFKEELSGYTETPPPAVWDALEKRLKSEDKRRVFPYRWFWYVSIVSFIVLLGSSIAWKMSRYADNHAKLTSARGTATSIPQHAAATADNMPSTNNDANNNPTAPKHTANTNLAGNTGEKNVQEEKITTTSRNRHNRRHPAKRVQKQNISKETNDDLYADTEDDQYTVGGTPNRRSTQSADGEGYVTDARTQHNIRVAETEPSQKALENNYSGNTAVTATNARAVSSAHYDIDMSSDNATIGNSNAKNQRTKTSNKPAHEQLYATTAKHVTTHKRGLSNYIPSSAFAEAPSKIAKKEKMHIANTSAANKNEIKVAKDKATQKTNPAIATNTTSRAITSRKNPDAAITTSGKQHKERTQNNVPQISGASAFAVSANDESKSKKNSKEIASNTTSLKDNKKQTVSDPSTALASVPVNHVHKHIAEEKKTQAKKELTVIAASTPSTATVTVIPNHAPNHKMSNTSPAKTTTEKMAHSTYLSASVPTTTTSDALKPNTGKTKNVSVKENKTEPVIAALPATQTAATKRDNTHKHRTDKTKAVKGSDATSEATVLAAIPGGTQKSMPTKAKKHADEMTGVGINTSKPVTKGNSKHHTAQPINNYAAEKPATEHNTKSTATKTSVDKGRKQRTVDEQKTTSASKPGISESRPTEKNATDEIVETMSKNTTKTIAAKKAATEIAIAKNENKGPKKENTKSGRKSNNKSAAQPAVQPTVYMYSNSLLNRSPEDETVLADNLKVNSFTDKEPISTSGSDEIIPGTFRNDNGTNSEKVTAAGATANNNDSTTRHHFFFTKFEAGVKGGYETAFNGYGANKLVISPYLQYNLSDKFSIFTQPSVKMSHVNNHHVGQDTNYNDRSHTVFTQTDTGALYTVSIVGGNAIIIRNLLTKYNATYDSIVKSYNTRNTYLEIELPLMLKYNIGKGLSIYGGANGIYSKYTSINEQTNHYTGTAHTITITPPGSTPMPPNASNLNLPGTPITKYTGPLYPEQKGGLLRMGYMLGFSYEYKKRWLFDVLMQQAMVQPHYEAGHNTNLPLSLPYFRFTLGYKLTK